MAESRTLKLSILADVDNLRKNLSNGSQEVEGFGSKVADFGKKAAAAFAVAAAAAAAYATKLAIDGVKAAIEDEQAQATLAATIERVTGAKQKTIDAVEDYITKTALAVGVTDDELRPAFGRLITSVENVKKSQDLLNLALDISAATGKSVESIAQALARAYDGNTAALKKLGIETATETTIAKDNTNAKQAAERAQLAYNSAIDKYGASSIQAQKAGLIYTQALENVNNVQTTTVKGALSFDQIIGQLTDKFGGAAAVNADTFAGKMARLKISFDEAKETIGSYILTALVPLIDFSVNKVVPAIDVMVNAIGPTLKNAFANISSFVSNELIPIFTALSSFIQNYILPLFVNLFGPAISGLANAFNQIKKAISDNYDELQPFYSLLRTIANFVRDFVAPAIGEVLGAALRVVGSLVSTLINNFGRLVSFLDDVLSKIREFVNYVRNNPIISGISGVIDRIFGGGRATGGPVTQGTAYMVGERGPELFVPNTSGSIIPNNALGGNTININVSGAIDPESTARQIIQILNASSYRGTLGAGALV